MKKFVLIASLMFFVFSSCATKVVTRTPASQVVVVKTPPKNHKVVVVKGKRYYKWNGKYHRKTSRGYVVVKI